MMGTMDAPAAGTCHVLEHIELSLNRPESIRSARHRYACKSCKFHVQKDMTTSD